MNLTRRQFLAALAAAPAVAIAAEADARVVDGMVEKILKARALMDAAPVPTEGRMLADYNGPMSLDAMRAFDAEITRAYKQRAPQLMHARARRRA